jgi:hypothetical protein
VLYAAYGYQDNSRNEKFGPLKSFAIRLNSKYTLAMRAAVGPLQENSIATCRSACDTNSPSCLRLKFGGSDGAVLQWLHKTGLGSPPTVKKSDILAAFKQKDDRCEREDTTISGGFVRNSGLSGGTCLMKANLGLSNVTVAIPQDLVAKYEVKGSSIEARFENAKTRANVTFEDRELNDLWGGEIVAVASEPTYMGFSIGKDRCVRIRY